MSIMVGVGRGAQVPLAQLATLRFKNGPPAIRDENGMLAEYVFVDMTGREVGSYVEDLKQVVREKVSLPTGYTIIWSGQYEYMQRVRERLTIFIPLTLAIIFVPYYVTFRSVAQTRDGHARSPAVHGGRDLGSQPARLQREYRRVGRADRIGRGRGRDKRDHARVLRRSLCSSKKERYVTHPF